MAEDHKEKTMSQSLKLNVKRRTKIGKNANRKLRAGGVIPAVFYTSGSESVALEVNEAALNKLYAQVGRTTLFDLDVEGTSHPALIWDVEYYPTKNRFQHVDFYGVDLNKEIKVRVPLEFFGVAKGTKLGGKLEVYRELIHVFAKPADLPKKIEVNIADLDVGQGLRVADLAMPAGARAAYDVNFAILTVTLPGAGKDAGAEGQAAL